MHGRRGFTLVEILTALVVAGIAVSIASAMFASASDVVIAMQRRAEHTARDENGLEWLEDAILGADVSLAAGGDFAGGADSLSFRSMLLVPAGWVEPTRVRVTFERGRLAIRTDRETHVLPDSLASVTFDYLAEYGATSPWLARWESGTGAPLAIRLRRTSVSGADTLLFYVGRGR